MNKIMFVCHGNICRSPMAEFIFRDLVQRSGRGDAYHIASAATSTEEIWGDVGNPVYPPARDELLRHGLRCDGKRAVQVKKSDYDKYDLFVVMDSNNVRNIMRIFGHDKENKVRKLMEFTPQGGDVADPWYSRNFKKAYDDIELGCKYLFKYLEENENA